MSTEIVTPPKPGKVGRPAAKSLKFSPGNHTYWLNGKRVRGVTGLISGGLPKPALIKWGPKFVAQIVEEWRTGEWPEERNELHADLYKAIDAGRFPEWLARTPDQYRDKAGARGHDVHEIAEQIIHGIDVEVPDWLMEWVTPYVDWLDEWDVKPILTEQSVASETHWYAGRIDCIATVGKLGGAVCGLDWKTSTNVYSATALQIAAYVRAEFTVTDEEPEVFLPIPEVERTLVVHIAPGATKVHDLGRSPAEIDEAFQDFLRVAAVAKRIDRIDGRWDPKLRKPVGGYLGDPLDLNDNDVTEDVA